MIDNVTIQSQPVHRRRGEANVIFNEQKSHGIDVISFGVSGLCQLHPHIGQR